ncbi:MAG: adenylyltransferase [Actinomycetota bacterium]|jgi:ATP adenylyltransferase|nr:adenylyltransferase [Actinomycetota bacterium]
MERLWTPWRMQYVSTADDDNDCIFCAALEGKGDPDLTHVLYTGERVFALLNAFPYNTGHLMIAPKRHVGDVSDLDVDERHDLFDLTTRSIEVIRETLEPHGFNTGMNLGRVAGAGIPGHVHMHVVPRWGGDTNFMPIVGETKVLPEMLAETAAKLRPAFAAL